ncbi:MAG: diguanylate cyclase [Oscillospiraceae bacterium]
MKSIQTKIILLIILVSLVTSLIIGGAGILNANAAIERDSVQIINLLCREKAQELNSTLGRIEQSVKIMGEYAATHIESTERLVYDKDYRTEYVEVLKSVGLTAANMTDGAVSYYMRFAPGRFSDTEGFFQVKNKESGEFDYFPVTDLGIYSPDDIEHVGWYYIPVEKGCATWVNPYHNREIDVLMISYVEPIYHGSELIGVVGMDIDFGYVSSFIDSIAVYDTGYAFLTDSEFNIVYHKFGADISVRELSEELANEDGNTLTNSDKLYDYQWNGSSKHIALRTLNNGMCLAVTAPASEIDAGKNVLVRQILEFGVLITLVFILVSSIIARSLVSPLKELNEAAKEIADGNLDVKLTVRSKDEIGTLTRSFRETADRLKEQIDYINSLAYTDSLTGVNNNTAYQRDVNRVRGEIRTGCAHFSLAVIDVNGLKQINDNYGHEYGNMLISATAEAVAKVFGREHVFRIGGDEFAVLMRDTTLEECRELADRFHDELKVCSSSVSAAAAVGISEYVPADSCYEEVFRRADEEMYHIKTAMKKNGEVSRVLSGVLPQ